MKFSDYTSELDKLHERSKALLVDEEVLCESFNLKTGEHLTVFLGDKIMVRKNQEPAQEGSYQLRPYYTTRDNAWLEALGDLKTKITLAEALNKKLVKDLVQPYLKEAVLDRLTGQDDVSDNEELLKRCAQKRIRKLQKTLPQRSYANCAFHLPSPSVNFTLQVKFVHSSPEILWGDGFEGLKANWSFLQNYEKIVETVAKFAALIEPVFDFCEK
jgi:hypothetical protein